MDDERGMANWVVAGAFWSSCGAVMTMEFERCIPPIGTTNDPVRTIDDERGRPASVCCAEVRTIDDERCNAPGTPAPVANGMIGTAAMSWDTRTIDDERCKAPGTLAGGTVNDLARSSIGVGPVGTAAGAAATGAAA